METRIQSLFAPAHAPRELAPRARRRPNVPFAAALESEGDGVPPLENEPQREPDPPPEDPGRFVDVVA